MIASRPITAIIRQLERMTLAYTPTRVPAWRAIAYPVRRRARPSRAPKAGAARTTSLRAETQTPHQAKIERRLDEIRYGVEVHHDPVVTDQDFAGDLAVRGLAVVPQRADAESGQRDQRRRGTSDECRKRGALQRFRFRFLGPLAAAFASGRGTLFIILLFPYVAAGRPARPRRRRRSGRAPRTETLASAGYRVFVVTEIADERLRS